MLVYIELIILITLILTVFIALNIFLLLESSLVKKKKRLILQLKGKKKIYLNALTDLVFDINDTFRKKKKVRKKEL